MKPTDTKIYFDRIDASDKAADAIIARNFSASRMNATKWREIIEGLQDIGPLYRVRFVWDRLV